MEIGLNSPILESNTQVISFPIHKWDPDLFASSLKFVKNELHPFVIFGLNGSLPVSQEVCYCLSTDNIYVFTNTTISRRGAPG